MWLKKDVVRRFSAVVAVGCAIGMAAASVGAQEQTPIVLVLDETAIDHGPPPHVIPADAVNDLVRSVGLRDPLPYFNARVGSSATLPSGAAGNFGWFALRNVPAAWMSEDGDDGLVNYLLAGPGLGSPDAAGSRTSLLENVPDVVTLRAAGLNRLVGRRACAVVYDEDIQVMAGTPTTANLNGVNLGMIAFEVTAVDSTPDSPGVTVQILDVRTTCGGAVSPFAEAPDEGQ
jgi:hypothetical protein